MKLFLDYLMKLNWQPADYAQIITSLITLLTVVVSVTSFSKQINRDRKNKAVQIGVETERLVLRWAYLDMVLSKCRPYLYQFLSEIDTKNMVLFERDEIDLVFTKEEQGCIRNFFLCNNYNSQYSGSPVLKFNVPDDLVAEANDRFPQVFNEVYPAQHVSDYQLIFQRVVIDTLNKMETLCLMMCKGIADEKMVFETVNDKFIHIVKVLYYYIAMINDPSVFGNDLSNAKKMKHVIKVFGKWERRRKRIKNRARIINKIKNKNTICM